MKVLSLFSFRSRLFLGLVLLLLWGTGCVLNPRAISPTIEDLSLPDYEDLVPDGATTIADLLRPDRDPLTGNIVSSAFISTLARYNISLSEGEIQELQRRVSLAPNGNWARNRNASSQETLESNFERFGSAFDPPPVDANEYKERALAFADKLRVPYYLDLQYYSESKQLLVVKWDRNTREFIIVEADGSLVNYLISSVVTLPRYVQIDL